MHLGIKRPSTSWRKHELNIRPFPFSPVTAVWPKHLARSYTARHWFGNTSTCTWVQSVCGCQGICNILTRLRNTGLLPVTKSSGSMVGIKEMSTTITRQLVSSHCLVNFSGHYWSSNLYLFPSTCVFLLFGYECNLRVLNFKSELNMNAVLHKTFPIRPWRWWHHRMNCVSKKQYQLNLCKWYWWG